MDNKVEYSHTLNLYKRYKISNSIKAKFVSGNPNILETDVVIEPGTVIQLLHFNDNSVMAINISSGNTEIYRLDKKLLFDNVNFFECDLWKRAIYQNLYQNKNLFKVDVNLNLISDFIEGEKYQNIPSAIEISDFVMASVKSLILENFKI